MQYFAVFIILGGKYNDKLLANLHTQRLVMDLFIINIRAE